MPKFPNDEETPAAPVDGLLIASTFWRDDEKACHVLLKHCDPYSVILQLTGWLRASVRHTLACGGGEQFGDADEFDVLRRWLEQVRQEQEVTP